MRVLIWVQHLRGIGHLRRMSLIADALAARGAVVTIVSGGLPVPGFEAGRFTVKHLSPVQARDATYTRLTDAAGRPVNAMLMRGRTRDLLAVFEKTIPDVIITELFPFGRRKFRGELLPFLETARERRPRPLILSSIREILEPQPDPERIAERLQWAHRYFGGLLVHGDPDFLKLEPSAPWISGLRLPVHYTGYVVAAVPAAAASDGGEHRLPEVVVSAGGGRGGGRLLDTAEAAALLIGNRAPLRWRLVCGPNRDRPVSERNAAHHSGGEIILQKSRDDMPALIGAAALSVSRAGYNTVAEGLAARARMILVPDTAGSQREQALRADHLARQGLAVHMAEPVLTPAALARAVVAQLSAPHPTHNIRLDGAAQTARLIAELRQRQLSEEGLARP